MKDGSAVLGPPSGSDPNEALLSYGVDTAKRIAGRIGHDFNNLIAVVQGYAAVLRERPGLDADSKVLAALIEQAGAELASLTERMVAFASTPANNHSRVNLNALMEELYRQDAGSIPEGIQLNVRLGHSVPDLLGNPALIREVCRNVWQNAIESMPDGGQLTCQTSTLAAEHITQSSMTAGNWERYVCLQISDTGQGMTQEIRANMFAPFFTTKPGKMRGLGATVVYEAVKSHHGHIRVSSESGLGTCVALYFPAAEDMTEQSSPNSE